MQYFVEPIFKTAERDAEILIIVQSQVQSFISIQFSHKLLNNSI